MRAKSALLVVAALLLLAASLVSVACQRQGEGTAAAEDPNELAHFRLEDGPLEEVRVRRDTRGGFVVSGFCFFPEMTQLALVLYDADEQAVARTQVQVQNSLFQSLPLTRPDGRRWPGGAYAISVEAVFAPGAQPDRVLQSSKGGQTLSGDGMTTTVQGRPAFVKRFAFVLLGDGAH